MQAVATLTLTFLRIFSRDRQAIFFSLFFPLIFMTVFGLVGNRQDDAMPIGIVDHAGNALAQEFIDTVKHNKLFDLSVGSEEELRARVVKGDLKVVLILPPAFQDNGTPTDLKLVVDAAQVRELGVIMPVLQQALVDIERSLRHEEPLFRISLEDVKARQQNYLSFLVPGLLAFTIMQLSIGGSGYNIVEFRRKGILKRLFVTPILPRDFIGGLVVSRSLICLLQLCVLMTLAVFVFHVSIAGNPLSLVFIVILGTAVFLSIGFSLGSIAKTQQAIMAIGNLVTFPQMFLSGIFYPIDILPSIIQPLAKILPLSFLSTSLREIIVNGAQLTDILPDLAGLAVWAVVAMALAVKLFVWKEVAA